MAHTILKLGSRRFYSTKSIDLTLSEAAMQLRERVYIRKQFLDIQQLLRLSSTLHFPTSVSGQVPWPRSSPLHRGRFATPIPPCHHLIYFTPRNVEHELGADGSDMMFDPPKPFIRRIWAGGELEWVHGNMLLVGAMATETTRSNSVEEITTSAGDDMLVVRVEKKFSNRRGPALLDRRNWIFRKEIDPDNPPPLPALSPRIPFPSAPYTRDITHTPISLFRFSALTFNSHKIHYNREWCREVEGHRDCVVHGPLNLIHMVDFWRDIMGKQLGNDMRDGTYKILFPKKVTYRATSPLYVGETYRILMEEEKENISDVRIVDGFGNVGMVGKIERW